MDVFQAYMLLIIFHYMIIFKLPSFPYYYWCIII